MGTLDDALLGALLGTVPQSSGNSAAGWPLADIAGDDDFSGDEMVLGDGDLGDEMVLGAALAAASPSAKRQLVNAIRSRKLRNASLVTPRQSAEANLQPLGLESLAVAPAAQVLVSTQPQTLYKPMRLMVPQTFAANFVLNDIKVGNVSQLPSAIPIPCEAFSQSSFGAGISLKTVNPAINLSVLVTNISAAAADFRGAFFGESVQ